MSEASGAAQCRREAASGEGIARALVAGALALLGAALAYRAVLFLAACAAAVRFPFNLDYGEGIVWQQLLLMLDGRAYGGIDGFPAVVFHYPPVFHGLAAALAAVTGMDQLAAGRLLSMGATVSIALVGGALAFRAARADAAIAPSAACAGVAGLVVFTFMPVMAWAPFMRVDMVAVAFSVLGVYCGVRSPDRPRLVHAAAVCFVLAVYTKQTSLAAPCATFLILGLVRPRLAAAGVCTALATAAALLAVLSIATDGGFLRHLVLYNINRFHAGQLWVIAPVLAMNAVYAVAAAVVLFGWVRGVGRGAGPRAWFGDLRRRVASSERDRILAVSSAYLVLTTAMLAGIGKSGSAVNYFIEWMCVWSVPIGLSVRGAAVAAFGRAAAGVRGEEPMRRHAGARLTALVLLAVQAVALPNPTLWFFTPDPTRLEETRGLIARVAEARTPVISDDMVLLIQAGKPVVWEPAIFAELASTGRWDEAPFVSMVEARAFAFFITSGSEGDPVFESRYTPLVRRALASAYPRKELQAGYVLHLPAE